MSWPAVNMKEGVIICSNNLLKARHFRIKILCVFWLLHRNTCFLFLCNSLCTQVTWQTQSSFSWNSQILQTGCLWLWPLAFSSFSANHSPLPVALPVVLPTLDSVGRCSPTLTWSLVSPSATGVLFVGRFYSDVSFVSNNEETSVS